ncbi:MAG: hypothetical protein JSS39_02365 [Nitrospira sp.]|nr:hypothetical protein [Nitrospira sp.]
MFHEESGTETQPADVDPFLLVIPACFKRESRKSGAWMPAFAGMTLFLEAAPSFLLPGGANRPLVMATAQLRNPG